MKTAIWILSILIVALLIISFMQWRMIQKLNPDVSRTTDPGDDGSSTFGDMVKAVQKEVRNLEIKATF